MGNKKRKNLKNKRNKNKRQQAPLIPLTEEDQELLTNEGIKIKLQQILQITAICAMSLLKTSKEQLSAGQSKIAYVLSKQWFEQWKAHVGYDAFNKGEIPSGRKYGRVHPSELNKDIVASNYQEEYHSVPVDHEEYQFLDFPLKGDVQPIKDYILVSQKCWQFFYEIYGGKVLERHVNLQGEFDLKMIRPYVIFFTEELVKSVQKLKESEFATNICLINHKRLQLPIVWDYEQLINYINCILKNEDNLSIRIWKVESFLSNEVIKQGFIKSVNGKKYSLRGDVSFILNLIINQLLELSEIKGLKLNQYLKSSYTLVVETQLPGQKEFLISRSDKTGKPENNSLCEYCGQKSKLPFSCICKRTFYCCLKCKYSDQQFHSNLCLQAYDSEDDEEIEKIGPSNQQYKGRGLQNLGNTCYMNSAIQSLLSSKKLQNFLLKQEYYPGNVLNVPSNIYLNQFRNDKKKIMLNFKFEKLLKNLCFLNDEKSLTPLSFRSQFSKVHPYFGGDSQMDSAEFLSYLLDALNEEIITLKGLQPPIQQEEIDEGIVDIDKLEQMQVKDEENSDDSGSSDEQQKDGEPEEQKQQEKKVPRLNFEEYKLKKQKNSFYNSKDPQSVWENTLQGQSKLLTQNFVGVLQSDIKCGICQMITKTYDPFNMLSLPLNHHSESEFIDVYVVFKEFSKTFIKQTLKYDSKVTMISDLKIEVAQIAQIDPTSLIGTISFSKFVNQYLFHDEDLVSEAAKPTLTDDEKYLVFIELTKPLFQMTEDEIFMGVELWCKEERSGFTNVCENVTFSTCHSIMAQKKGTLLSIYKSIFECLGQFSNSTEIMNFIPQNLQNEEDKKNQNQDDLLELDKVIELLDYAVEIQYKLPSKCKCPFGCAKSFKKEQKEHQCQLPMNDDIPFSDYLDKVNYKDGFITIVVSWGQKTPPKEFRYEFDRTNKKKQQSEPILTLEQCIQSFQKIELLGSDNAYFCDKCQNLSTAEKQMSIFRSPNQLIVQLKRFQVDLRKGVNTKITSVVDYPLQFALNVQDQVKIYALYGVVIHFGSLDGGHYIAYGKRLDKWYEFNDEKVTQIKATDVDGHKDAYLLMYEEQ